MAKNDKLIEGKLRIKVEDFPLESNLGLLAYGDMAFTAWRKLKKEDKKRRLENYRSNVG